MRFLKKKQTKNIDQILQTGWQFFHRPTNLEPVGTVFRIDDKNRKYMVEKLLVKSSQGFEATAQVFNKIEISAGVIAKFLDIGSKGDANTKLTEIIQFKLIDQERETTTDSAIDMVLNPFLKELNYRTDNKYYIIRECRLAKSIILQLQKERVVDLGVEAKLNESLGLEANFRWVNENLFEIDYKFPELMRIMFLPEEIRPISAALGMDQPELGRVPVNKPLSWVE